jgi:pyruvate-formate lyase-activating enzyme
MTSSTPLTGIELVDCAKANAKQGIEITAELCGYGSDTATFQRELQHACSYMKVDIKDLSDLIDNPTALPTSSGGIDIAPDSEVDF